MMRPSARHLGAVNRQLDQLMPSDVHPYETFELPPIYTLVAHPPDQIQNNIRVFSKELSAKLSSDDYYYAAPQLHTTLQYIGTKINDNTLPTLRTILKGRQIAVTAYGVGVNSRGVAVPVYDQSNGVLRLREELRSALDISTNYTEHNKIWEELMWVSFTRFKRPPSQATLQTIREYRDRYIGSYAIQQWQLYKTSSRVLDPKKSELIEVFI